MIRYPLYDPRARSLVRGSLMVFAGVALAFWLSDFPHNRATPLLVIPSLLVMIGMADTARCLQPKYNLYHGSVILCLYMDLMAVALVLFAWLYPYVERLAYSR